MPDIRIKDLTTTASTTAADDFFAADGATNGTRKLSAFSPSFGGNATVGGTLTVNGLATATSGVQINGGSFAAGKIYHDAAAGLVVAGKTGSTNDFLLTDPTGAFTVLANLTGTANLITGGTFKVNATTASTTTSSGALVVGNGTSGGLGVGGAANIGGALSMYGEDFTIHNVGYGSWVLRNTAGSAVFDIRNGAGSWLTFPNLAGTVEFKTLATTVKVAATTASTSTSSGALVVSGGVGVGGNTNIGGVASVGGSSSAAVGVYVINTALTGTDQYGVASEPIWTSAANLGHTLWARTKTAASAFTLTAGHGVFVEIPTLGAGSAITNNYGVRINNQGTTGVTNAYGLYVASQSGASTLNYAIYTAGGRINFQGLPTSSAGLPAGTLWNDSGTLKVA